MMDNKNKGDYDNIFKAGKDSKAVYSTSKIEWQPMMNMNHSD